MSVFVFVVTALPDTAKNDDDRHDLAKFFTRDDAQAHVDRLHKRWYQVRIEEREEPDHAQHPSHAEAIAALKR